MTTENQLNPELARSQAVDAGIGRMGWIAGTAAVGAIVAGSLFIANRDTGSAIESDPTEQSAEDPAEAVSDQEVDPNARMPIAVVGEAPCGPKIDQEEVDRRLAAGETIIKTSETGTFLNENPQVERGLNDFWAEQNGGDAAWIDYIIENTDPLDEEVLRGGEDEGVRGLKARFTAAELPRDIDAQNNNCDLETGDIFANPGPNGQYNRLQEGEPVWMLTIDAELRQAMQEAGIKMPDNLLAFAGENDSIEIIMERLACNNPIVQLPPKDPEEPVTPPVTTDPEEPEEPGKPPVTTAAPSAPVTVEPAPTTTARPAPSTAPAGTLPAGVTPTTHDLVPNPVTSQGQDDAQTGATAPSTSLPPADSVGVVVTTPETGSQPTTGTTTTSIVPLQPTDTVATTGEDGEGTQSR